MPENSPEKTLTLNALIRMRTAGGTTFSIITTVLRIGSSVRIPCRTSTNHGSKLKDLSPPATFHLYNC